MSRFRQSIRRDALCLEEREILCLQLKGSYTPNSIQHSHTCYQYLHIRRGGARHEKTRAKKISGWVGYAPVMRSVYIRLNLNLGESVFLGSTCMLRRAPRVIAIAGERLYFASDEEINVSLKERTIADCGSYYCRSSSRLPILNYDTIWLTPNVGWLTWQITKSF